MVLYATIRPIFSWRPFISYRFYSRTTLLRGFVAVACGLCVFFSSATAIARGRHNYGRNAAAAAKANRARMISSIQKQVSNARAVLKSAESQSVMSQAELNAASSKLAGIREEIDNTHQDAVQAAKTLREIEAEITLHQTPNSDFAKSLAAVDDAKEVVHQTIQSVLGLKLDDAKPGVDVRQADLKQLSDSQLSKLKADPQYVAADKALKDAARTVSKLRQTLFEADPDWTAAHRDLVDAHLQERNGAKERRVTGSAAAEKRMQLQNVNNVAVTARSIISLGEFRLRQLGVSTGSSKTMSQTRTK